MQRKKIMFLTCEMMVSCYDTRYFMKYVCYFNKLYCRFQGKMPSDGYYKSYIIVWRDFFFMKISSYSYVPQIPIKMLILSLYKALSSKKSNKLDIYLMTQNYFISSQGDIISKIIYIWYERILVHRHCMSPVNKY